MISPQQAFNLKRSFFAAKASGHIFPDFAACETALESSWFTSELCQKANNLFGLKHPKDRPLLKGCGVISMPTTEFLHGEWVHNVPAEWVSYPDWTKCFIDRMSALQHLAPAYPHYKAALEAKSGEEFVEEVSKTWSTDQLRAKKVLEIHSVHKEVFENVS